MSVRPAKVLEKICMFPPRRALDAAQVGRWGVMRVCAHAPPCCSISTKDLKLDWGKVASRAELAWSRGGRILCVFVVADEIEHV
eukprot:183960-Amphidinium_carterae.1